MVISASLSTFPPIPLSRGENTSLIFFHWLALPQHLLALRFNQSCLPSVSDLLSSKRYDTRFNVKPSLSNMLPVSLFSPACPFLRPPSTTAIEEVHPFSICLARASSPLIKRLFFLWVSVSRLSRLLSDLSWISCILSLEKERSYV